MEVRFTLDISESEELMINMEGRDELEIEVDVYITAWDRDERGHASIEDLEFGGIELVRDDGSIVAAAGRTEELIMGLLDDNEEFDAAIRRQCTSRR